MSFLHCLGVVGKEKRRVCKKLEEVAESVSAWIWWKRSQWRGGEE